MWKGNIIYELLCLPKYWWDVWTVDRTSVIVERKKFGEHGRQYYLKCREKEALHSEDSNQNSSANPPERIVIYWHGGGWWLGKPEQFVQNAHFFTRLGYKVYMPSYRRVPRYDIRAIREDLVLFFKELRKAYEGSELPELILSGMSAGGHLAHLVAMDTSLLEQSGWPSEKVVGLISWCAPLDIESMSASLPLRWLCRRSAELKAIANPKNYLKHRNPNFPIICIHGTEDGMVNNASAWNYKAAMIDSGINFKWLEFKSGHLEIARWSIPDSKYWQISYRQILQVGHIQQQKNKIL